MPKVKEIISLKNSQIKQLKRLTQKKYRRQSGMFLVENLAIIFDALQSGYDFYQLYVTQEFADKNKDKLDYLLSNTGVIEYYLISADCCKSYSQLDTPSGITAVFNKKVSSLDKNKSVVYLNGIKDPGNIGTIMRSALAFGVDNIVLDDTCVDIYNYKSVSAARDSIFKLNILEGENVSWLRKIKGVMPIYVADSNSGIKLPDIEKVDKFCLVLGSESHGVEGSVLSLSDQKIQIEISDNIESLNVSSAAAILLHGLKMK